MNVSNIKGNFLEVIKKLLFYMALYLVSQETKLVYSQRAKKVVSDSLGLVDFPIGPVIFVLNLPDWQVLFFGEIQITEGL